MGGKTRERLWGDRVRAARVRAEHAHRQAKEAQRAADAAACQLWSEQMEGFGGPAQPSPTIAQALNAGYGFLEVQCKRRETRTTVPLEFIRRPRNTPVWKLEASLSCRRCAPFVRRRPQTILIKLTKAKGSTSYAWRHPPRRTGIEGACRTRWPSAPLSGPQVAGRQVAVE
jgi:hypothetical protein